LVKLLHGVALDQVCIVGGHELGLVGVIHSRGLVTQRGARTSSIHGADGHGAGANLIRIRSCGLFILINRGLDVL